MKPKISIITLAVSDLAAARAFYRDGLGLPENDASNQDIAFFSLEGTWLSLYPRDKLAEDIGIGASGDGFRGLTLAHNVGSQQAVRDVIEQAAAAGATILKQPQEVFWGGYSGYFQDPDGHIWEVAHNPFTDLT